MQLKETETLLREMFAIDGRILDADRIKAWHNSIGFMPLEIAQQALRMARQDTNLGYLEPKHLIAKAKAAAEELDREERLAQQREKKEIQNGDPCPTCKHGTSLISCDECCKNLWRFHKQHVHLKYNDEFCMEYLQKEVLA